MVVSETVFWWLVAGGVAALSTLSGAVYMNRRKLNVLYQRLFGAEMDPTDDGYIVDIDRELKEMRQEMNDQHREVARLLKDMNGDLRRWSEWDTSEYDSDDD